MSDVAEPQPARGFEGLTVVAFESRRAVEMASLIERNGGVAVAAPTLRETAIAGSPDARELVRSLRASELDAIVAMTGVGTRTLVASLGGEIGPAELADLFRKVRVIARGPKPASALKEIGVTGFAAVPEPNTWREVLAVLTQEGLTAPGKHIAVQEHGGPSDALYSALRDAGVSVTPVAVYRWALPDDTAPLRRALHTIAGGGARIALFTSATQVEHALRVAAEERIETAVKDQLVRGCVGSIGPVCSEALRGEGLAPDVEPEHPKMGHLVKAVAQRAAGVLAQKDSA